MSSALDVRRAAADVVDGLVVEHDADVAVLQKRVRGEHGVVGLVQGGGDRQGGEMDHPCTSWEPVSLARFCDGRDHSGLVAKAFGSGLLRL